MRNLPLILLGFYSILKGSKAELDSVELEKANETKKLQLDFLNSEYKNTNDRLAGYSEADQKIIVVAATIIVGALGLTLTKFGPEDIKRLPYVFFLTAGLINLAVIQSVLYSSLALFALERKTRLTLKIEDLLGIPRSETTIKTFALNLTYRYSYLAALVPYYIFKSLAGGILFSFIFKYDIPSYGDYLYWTAFIVSALSSVASFIIVWNNAYEQHLFSKYYLKSFMKDEAVSTRKKPI